MKRQNDEQQIAQLLSKFMAGQTSLAEEQLLAQYFRTHDVGEEWAEYKEMFAMFDSGEVDVEVNRKPKFVTLRWLVAAVAASVLLLLALRLSQRPAEEPPAVTYTATSSQSKPQPVTTPIVKEKPEAVVAEAQPTKQKRKAPPSCVPLVASEQSSSAAPEGATIDPSHDSKTIEAPSVAVGGGFACSPRQAGTGRHLFGRGRPAGGLSAAGAAAGRRGIRRQPRRRGAIGGNPHHCILTKTYVPL